MATRLLLMHHQTTAEATAAKVETVAMAAVTIRPRAMTKAASAATSRATAVRATAVVRAATVVVITKVVTAVDTTRVLLPKETTATSRATRNNSPFTSSRPGPRAAVKRQCTVRAALHCWPVCVLARCFKADYKVANDLSIVLFTRPKYIHLISHSLQADSNAYFATSKSCLRGFRPGPQGSTEATCGKRCCYEPEGRVPAG